MLRRSKVFEQRKSRLAPMLQPKVSKSINLGSIQLAHLRETRSSLKADFDFRMTRYKNHNGALQRNSMNMEQNKLNLLYRSRIQGQIDYNHKVSKVQLNKVNRE